MFFCILKKNINLLLLMVVDHRCGSACVNGCCSQLEGGTLDGKLSHQSMNELVYVTSVVKRFKKSPNLKDTI